MIFSGDKLMRDYLNTDLGIEPHPTSEQFQPASLDVRIGEELLAVSADEMQDTLRLEPETFYLGTTLERISMPKNAAAMLTGRSTVGRMGVTVHCTAGFIDPCFSGNITLEMYNFSDEAVEFESGDRIGQLIFFEVEEPTDGYNGQYQDQEGVEKAGHIK